VRLLYDQLLEGWKKKQAEKEKEVEKEVFL